MKASIRNGWCFFYVWRNLFFLCPFLRKEVSTVANRIMGITVEIGAILAIFPERGQKVPPLSLFGGEKRPTYNKQRVQGKSYLLEQHLDGDISNAYLSVNLRSIKATKTVDKLCNISYWLIKLNLVVRMYCSSSLR